MTFSLWGGPLIKSQLPLLVENKFPNKVNIKRTGLKQRFQRTTRKFNPTFWARDIDQNLLRFDCLVGYQDFSTIQLIVRAQKIGLGDTKSVQLDLLAFKPHKWELHRHI